MNRTGIKFLAAGLLFVLASILSLIACTENIPAEPLVSDESIEESKTKLGYALAPTWLPEGFEYSTSMSTWVSGDIPAARVLGLTPRIHIFNLEDIIYS